MLFNIKSFKNKPLKLVYWGDTQEAVMTGEALIKLKLRLPLRELKTLTAVNLDPAAAAYLTDFKRILTAEDI